MTSTNSEFDRWAIATDTSATDALSLDVDVHSVSLLGHIASKQELLTRLLQDLRQTSTRSAIAPEASSSVVENLSMSVAVPQAIQENWPKLSNSQLPVEIYERILRLALDASSGSDGVALQSGSLKHFLDFWRAVRGIAPSPELALTSDGNLVVTWHRNVRRHIDAIFRSDGMVLYGFFVGKIASEGRDTVDGFARKFLTGEKWPV